jgi:hypothetical protein
MSSMQNALLNDIDIEVLGKLTGGGSAARVAK